MMSKNDQCIKIGMPKTVAMWSFIFIIAIENKKMSFL